jgi:hypothetical protein
LSVVCRCGVETVEHPPARVDQRCAPLAADGETVDKIIAVSVIFDGNGREL